MGLIDLAIQKTMEWRNHLKAHDFGLDKPSSPRSYYSSFYIQLREDIHRGIREAVKTLDEGWKRSVAFSILMEALYMIFKYGKKPEIVDTYNAMLDEFIGEH
ncbi:MAG: hypothetical protein DRO23_12030 [Thermoprotei archaeon]|nr:MAG: hypothetical protein DRO23_12030 [Thermoprotei archaeon]